MANGSEFSSFSLGQSHARNVLLTDHCLSVSATFIYVTPQIIRADSWNASYRVWAENVSMPGGEDPYLWVTKGGDFHLLYHRMNNGQQTGGHGYSAK